MNKLIKLIAASGIAVAFVAPVFAQSALMDATTMTPEQKTAAQATTKTSMTKMMAACTAMPDGTVMDAAKAPMLLWSTGWAFGLLHLRSRFLWFTLPFQRHRVTGCAYAHSSAPFFHS